MKPVQKLWCYEVHWKWERSQVAACWTREKRTSLRGFHIQRSQKRGSIENTSNFQTDSLNQFLRTKGKGRGQNSKSCGRHIWWTSWLPALVHKLHSKKCTTVQWAHLPHWGRQLHFLLLSAHHVRGRNEFSGSLDPCDLYCIGGWTIMPVLVNSMLASISFIWIYILRLVSPVRLQCVKVNGFIEQKLTL